MALIEFQNNTAPYLNADNLNNNFNYLDEKAQDIYSTNEIIIGKWLGKPLYRKVIDFGALPNTDTKDVATGVSDIESCRVNGLAKSNAGSNLPLPYAANTFNIRLSYQSATNVIRIQTESDRSSFNAYVVMEYTKTTDEGDE